MVPPDVFDGGGSVVPRSGKPALAEMLRFTQGYTDPVVEQASWRVDPTSGSDIWEGTSDRPLATMRELSRRFRGQRLERYVLLEVPNGLPDEDVVLAGFEIGDEGFLHIKGTPTLLQTGTATARTNHTGNIPNDLTDSNLADDWGNLGLIGERIRMTTGALAGGISWALKDLTGKKVKVGLWYPSSFSVPMPQFFTPGNIAPGDAYVVEGLPEVKSLTVDVVCSDKKATGERSTRLLFEDLRINKPDGIGANSVACNTNEGVGFLNCYIDETVPIRGGFQNWGTLFGSIRIPFGSAAASFNAHGCCASSGPVTISGSAYLTDCVFADCTFVEVFKGDVQIFNVGVLDCGFDGLAVWPGAVAQIWSQLWGQGNNGYGLKIYTAGVATPFFSLALTTLTGTSGDTIVGITPRTYAQIAAGPGYVDPTTLAMIQVHS